MTKRILCILILLTFLASSLYSAVEDYEQDIIAEPEEAKEGEEQEQVDVVAVNEEIRKVHQKSDANASSVSTNTTNISTNTTNIATNAVLLEGISVATMSDDTAVSFTPDNAIGIIIFFNRGSAHSATIHGIVSYRASDVHYCNAIVVGSDIETTTGALGGTTGTDGKFIISTNSADGKIYFENRHGGSRSLGYITFGK